ncbi:cell division protein ZapA [Qipengyuania zhejiangensis]|uniref:cell division protein ZapA n=1 Tax=Qipengyuania zhejiangensis TaxID=3077782 RepID=UPI002D7A336A|nr:cell division protein ZapA [Qipengyuania sp. Z2]
MSDVKLKVGGRTYTVACADGQEAHVEHLAGIVDSKLGGMGGNLSSNEAKNLLFAALLLADEVDEAQKTAPAPTAAPDFDAERLAAQLDRVATALENAAQVLESGQPSA